LKSDFARYNLADDDTDELDQDDFGWKIISTDVFRFPSHKSLLCAVLGEPLGLALSGRGVVRSEYNTAVSVVQGTVLSS